MEKNDEQISLGKSFINSLTVGHIKASKDYDQQAIEKLLSDGVLQGIPIIDAIFNLSRTISITRDYFFTRNVMVFLNGLTELTQEEIDEFVRKIEEVPDYSNKVGEKLLFLLNRCDCVDKPKLISKIFIEFVKHKITYDELNHIVYGIEKAFIEDLNAILEVFSLRKDWIKDNKIWERIYYSGFSNQKVNDKLVKYLNNLIKKPYSTFKDNLIEYEVNRYGIKFAEIILGEKYRREASLD